VNTIQRKLFVARAPIVSGHRRATALAALPPQQRAAVVLRHWAGLEPAEVGELLGCSPGTVRSQTARGLDKLREVAVGVGGRGGPIGDACFGESTQAQNVNQ
jgi:Sigma-70, region 4